MTVSGISLCDLRNPDNVWINDRFWQTLGIDPESRKKQDTCCWLDYIFENDAELALTSLVKHCADPSQPFGETLRYHHAQGHTVWIRYRGFIVRDNNGEPTRFLGIHNDISEQTRIYDSLKEFNSRFELAAGSAGIGVWDLNLLNNELIWDARMFSIFRVPFSDSVVNYEPGKIQFIPKISIKQKPKYRSQLKPPKGSIANLE